MHQRLIAFSVPFSTDLSKNKALRVTRWGGVYKARPARAAAYEIEMQCKLLSKNDPFIKDKVRIAIIVEKPTMRGDCINYVDTICDAIKKGIGVDDNQFMLELVDWKIEKVNPRIHIVVRQWTNPTDGKTE